jgi:putative endonuclease
MAIGKVRGARQLGFARWKSIVLEKFFLYILQSQKDGRYYVGVTKNVESRLDQHNRGVGKSTRSGKPWLLIHTEEYSTRSEAARREKQIKKQKSRSYIETQIRSYGQRSRD